MIYNINQNEFKSKLENSYPYFLYCIKWPSQPKDVKIGYGNKYRPSSSSYSTPFGSDGQITIWIPEEDIDKTEMYSIEKRLHFFLLKQKECKRGKNGGREVYKLDYIIAQNYIEEFIENQTELQYKKFETTISNYKKNFKPNSEDYTVFAYNLLYNVNNIKCIFCNRACSNQIYECLCLCDNEKTEIYVGSTCFKKLNHTYLKNSTVTASNYKLNKIINPQFEKQIEEEQKQYALNSSDINKDNVVDCYIQRIENNGRKEKSYIEKTHMNHIESYLMNNICHYIFNHNHNKTFNITIDNKFIEQYKLTNILNIITIYGLLCNSKYIILGPLDLDNNQFKIEFNHHQLNSRYITTYFSEYRNAYEFNYIKTNDQVQNLTVEQVNSLESPIPYISGFPGTGKSRICKYIVEQNRDKKILIITPTYSTRQSLVEDFESDYDNILPVVIASIYDKKLIINEFNPDIILVDEYGMIDIIGWYKIMNICNTFNKPTLKVFGDPYQLPPIDFETESQYIIKQMYKLSNKLTINFRSTSCPEQYNYLIENKCQYNIIDIQCKFETVPYNNDNVLSLLDDNYILLTGTNKSVNKINQINYNRLKTDCISCPTTETKNQIHLTNKDDITYTFCDKCIHRYNFIMTSNINCIKFEQNDKIELPNDMEAKMHPQYEYKIFPKDNSREKSYCYYSENREKIFYNGEIVQIKLGKKQFYRKYYIVTTKLAYGTQPKRVIVFDIETLFKNCINLPYARTVHKSQGQTIHKVAIIMDKSNIMSSSIYTAFTRAQKLESVKIMFPYTDIQVIINRNKIDDEDNIILNDSIKCPNCNLSCQQKTSYNNRKYWGCPNSKICSGGNAVMWINDNIQTEEEFGILKRDFDIENEDNKLVFKLKEGIDILNYRSFFKNELGVNTEPYGSRTWVIRFNLLEKKQKLIDFINNDCIRK